MAEHRLSDRERAFCRAYVANGHIGSHAAIAAGYSKNGADVAAIRLLKRKHVRDEIARLDADAARRVGKLLVDARRTGDRSYEVDIGSIGDQIRRETDTDRIAALTRSYVLAGIVENFEIALGRRKRTMVRFAKVKQTIEQEGGLPPIVKTVLEAQEYQTFDPNATAANQAGVILLNAIGPETNQGSPGAVVDDRQDIRELFAQFNAQEEAKQREREKERRR